MTILSAQVPIALSGYVLHRSSGCKEGSASPMPITSTLSENVKKTHGKERLMHPLPQTLFQTAHKDNAIPVQIALLPTKAAAILFRKLNAELPYLAEQGADINAQFPGGALPAAAVAAQRFRNDHFFNRIQPHGL